MPEAELGHNVLRWMLDTSVETGVPLRSLSWQAAARPHLQGAALLGEVRCGGRVQGLGARVLALALHETHRIHVGAKFQRALAALCNQRKRYIVI